MEEFLPLLIGIIWLVYTLYNRGQKKKNVRKPQPAKESDNKTPSFIEQLLMGEDVTQPQPYEQEETELELEPVVEKPVINKSERIKSAPFLTSELADFVHEGQSISEVYEFEEQIYEKSHDDENIVADFDLKKAVIFSEILNPPYIDYK